MRIAGSAAWLLRHRLKSLWLLAGIAVLAVAGSWLNSQVLREPKSGGTQRRVRLLTQEQYLNTLAYVFGADVRPQVNFAAVARTDGLLSVGTSIAGLTDAQLEIYQRTAAEVAAQVARPESRQFLIPCVPKDQNAQDAACATEFLRSVGRLLYRRPLSDARLTELVREADDAATRLHGFYAGIEVVLEGLLLSPGTLLVVERAEPDPQNAGAQRLDAYSLASRLSLLLWNAAPDDELLNAARSGELLTPRGRRRTVDRMLASPRFEAGMRAFFDDMLGLDATLTLAKDTVIYPSFTSITAQDSREQTLRTIVDHVLVRNADYRDLFTTRHTFLSPALATIYQVPAGHGWIPYDIPANRPSAGIITAISFLSLHSHPGRSSATRRGKALREILLCQQVPRPPPDVDFSAVENPDPNLHTARERVGAHLKNPACAGCHRVTDPTGLALESFDGAGQFRETEGGALVDTAGNLDGRPFTNVSGLGLAVHDNPSLGSCLVRRAYSYAVGAPTAPRDRALLRYLNKDFVRNGYRVTELFRTIAESAAFARIAPERVKPAPASVALTGAPSGDAAPLIVLAH